MHISFTNRTGGVSHGAFASLNLGYHVGDSPDDVRQNRELLASRLGPVQFMNQVHGDRIAIIEEVTDEMPTVDALVTGIPGISLVVMVADCIPLLLSSKESVAAVHVGRRGLLNGIAGKTISLMRDMGASQITATLGPSICGTCYEVSEDLFNDVVHNHPLTASKTLQGAFALDLSKGLRSVLEGEGVPVRDEGFCTYESSDHFSYRRDGVTGRQAGVIKL